MLYRDMEIEIFDQQPDGTFRICVWRSPAGELAAADAETARFDRHAIPQQSEIRASLDALLKRLSRRRASQAEMLELGGRLAEMLLPGRVGVLFRRSQEALKGGEEGLRLRLRILPRELADLPWELLSLPVASGTPGSREFLALKPEISITRGDVPAQARKGAPPGAKIRLALVLASPFGLADLDLGKEEKAILSALKAVDERGEVLDVVRLGSLTAESVAASRASLPEKVTGADIFHFAGYGRSRAEEHGQILLEDEAGDPDGLDASELAEWLARARLVFLGACDAGRQDGSNQWTAVAKTLIRKGIPAAISMADSMRVANATAFAAVLYARLLAGDTVDEAVYQGRKVIASQEPAQPERDWSAPILYLGAEAGPLFPLPLETAGPIEDQAVVRVRQKIGTVSDSRVIGLKAQDLLAGDVDVRQVIDEVKGGSSAIAAQLGTIGGRSRAAAVPGDPGRQVDHQGFLSPELREIGRRIGSAFNKEELNLLSAELDVNYENLPGATLQARAMELVYYCQRHGLTENLLAELRRQRTELSWDV